MKVALDSNVLVYAAGVNGAEKQELALEFIRNLPPHTVVVPVQVLGELYNVLTRKVGRAPESARASIVFWQETFTVAATSWDVLNAAVDISVAHQLAIWDAVIVSVAARQGCRLLLSEDMQNGFTWGGVTIVNPFASPRHPLLESLLGGNSLN